MARVYVFDDDRSLIHFFFAFAIFYLVRNIPSLTIIGTILFTIYEATEKENPVSTLGDFEEFIMGALLGIAFWFV